jgi:hypothetical protein
MLNKITNAAWVVLITITCWAHLPAEAGQVRASFLDDPAALKYTVQLLSRYGCNPKSLVAFSNIVTGYYTEPFSLDRTKFPTAKQGFYTFPSVTNLVQALPHKLNDTQHSVTLNCFDVMILLAGDTVQTVLRPDDNYGPFVVSKQLTNGGETIHYAATARDAFSLCYAQWYRDATASIFPEDLRDTRICLVAGLFRWHKLPMSTTQATVQNEVWKALTSDWTRAGLKFPSNFQVVLYHTAVIPAALVHTPHTGLLFPTPSGFTYLEKVGCNGPFVRLDVKEKSDLEPWMSAIFTEEQRAQLSLFATFNDASILGLNADAAKHR